MNIYDFVKEIARCKDEKVTIQNLSDNLREKDIPMEENEYFVMDETDAPYDLDNLPYTRSLTDDLFLVKLTEGRGAEFDEKTDLYALMQSIIETRKSGNVQTANGYVCPNCRITPVVSVDENGATMVTCDCTRIAYESV